MIDCVVYISSVANVRRHLRKTECLESFAKGVTNSGHRVHVERANVYTPAPLAVILGWATPDTIGGVNVQLRQKIIQEQAQRGFKTMCIDASCWKYLDNSSQYLRYSINGPYYDTSEYANKNSDPDKWNQIKSELNLNLEPYKTPGPNGYILICMQRDGGFSMKSLDPLQWLHNKITEIRRYTNRPILVRPHPGAYNMNDYAEYMTKKSKSKLNIEIIEPRQSKLIDNLHGAHATVVFNSSSSVAAICLGVPVFVDDQSCVSWQVANKDISRIENPNLFKREQWIYDLAAAHWSDEESRQGLIYKKFLPLLS
jgi:hypothetical protein